METSAIEIASWFTATPETFPRLSPAQMECLATVGKIHDFKKGEHLWQAGEKTYAMFVVVEGSIEIHLRQFGETRLIVRHGPGGFTGDIDILSDKANVVECVACSDTRTIEVEPASIKQLVVSNSELSDIVLKAFLARRQALITSGEGELEVIGSKYSPETFAVQEFLERNSRPYRWLDLENDPHVGELLDALGISHCETPVIRTFDGTLCRNPSLDELAKFLGLSTVKTDTIYDAIVVGAGPAGLASAVYAASEGLDVMVIDSSAPGGQASTSSKIENYLGFPTGISGRDLAQRAFVQAEKFGASIAIPRTARTFRRDENIYAIDVGGDEWVRARTVVIASGVQYRQFAAARTQEFINKGIYYGATATEAPICAQKEIAVIGGGNSAGQAAVFLSGYAKHVYIMIRSGGLEHSMSQYLIRRIDALSNVTLMPHTEITAFDGSDHLERIETLDNRSNEKTMRDIANVFIFIGAQPNTGWLDGQAALDEKGFVLTGRDVPDTALDPVDWQQGNAPELLETSLPGVFAAGDVRSGSTKRVASGVGEGSICVSFVHQALKR